MIWRSGGGSSFTKVEAATIWPSLVDIDHLIFKAPRQVFLANFFQISDGPPRLSGDPGHIEPQEVFLLPPVGQGLSHLRRAIFYFVLGHWLLLWVLTHRNQ
jgi:hypothetical protein